MVWYKIVAICLAASFSIESNFVNGCSYGSIMKVENPGSYTEVIATTRKKMCTTSWTEQKTHVIISDCVTDDEIKVVFDDRDEIIETGGSDVGKWTVIVRCHSDQIVETNFRNRHLDFNTKTKYTLDQGVSESASIESECIWLFMVWLALKIF